MRRVMFEKSIALSCQMKDVLSFRLSFESVRLVMWVYRLLHWNQCRAHAFCCEACSANTPLQKMSDLQLVLHLNDF